MDCTIHEYTKTMSFDKILIRVFLFLHIKIYQYKYINVFFFIILSIFVLEYTDINVHEMKK